MSDASSYALSTNPNDRYNQSLPSYSQVIQMKQNPSAPTAPLLEETNPHSIFGAATSLKFEFDSGDSFDYSFLIRDKAGRLQAKGSVSNLNVKLKNINGSETMNIIKNDSANYETTTHTFGIYHNHIEIGAIKVLQSAPAESCLQINNRSGNPQIIVRSLKVGDFAIFRGRSSATPICNIQLTNIESYVFGEFNGAIVFEPETGITPNEQLLCTAAGIAFKVVTKHVSKKSHDSGKFDRCCGAICCGLIFIVVLGIFWFLMDKWACEDRKSRGYAGYSHRQC